MSSAPRVTLEYIAPVKDQLPKLNVNFHGKNPKIDTEALAGLIVLNCMKLFQTEPITSIQILAVRYFDDQTFMDSFMRNCIHHGYEAAAYQRSKRLEISMECH